jgi:hypothetical protein
VHAYTTHLCRFPECCAQAALAHQLHQVFKIDGAEMPTPGTQAWDDMYIFPGRNAGLCQLSTAGVLTQLGSAMVLSSVCTCYA